MSVKRVLASVAIATLVTLLQAGPDRPGEVQIDSSQSNGSHKRALVTLTGAKSKGAEGFDLASTEPAFVSLWQKHLGQEPTGKYNSHYNPLGVPLIDFNRCLVIAIFAGQYWNSAGFAIDSISERDASIVVRYDDKSYQTAGPDGGGQRVSPYAFFVLPKTPKELILEKNVQGLIGHPPIWKEQHRFPAR